jgi:hypothetical protein
MREDDLTTTDDSIPDMMTKYDGPTTLGAESSRRADLQLRPQESALAGKCKLTPGWKRRRVGAMGQSCGILRINPSHDLPQGLGHARRGVSTTSASRLFFKPEKGKTRL